MILRISFFLVVFVGIIYGQNFESGDNETVKGCSSKCSYDDSTLECWNKTLYFFEKLLLGQMRHYLAVQINIDQWHRRHDKPYTANYTLAAEHAVQSMQQHLTADEDHVQVTNDTVKTVVETIFNRISNNYSHDISWVPHYSCPLPCEHKFTVWRNLFIISSILNLCLIVVVVPFARRMAKNDANEALI